MHKRAQRARRTNREPGLSRSHALALHTDKALLHDRIDRRPMHQKSEAAGPSASVSSERGRLERTPSTGTGVRHLGRAHGSPMAWRTSRLCESEHHDVLVGWTLLAPRFAQGHASALAPSDACFCRGRATELTTASATFRTPGSAPPAGRIQGETGAPPGTWGACCACCRARVAASRRLVQLLADLKDLRIERARSRHDPAQPAVLPRTDSREHKLSGRG
jgi:hypothetical protein